MIRNRADFDALSERERVEFTVSRLVSAVLNGGLPSYYYNSGAEYLYDCIEDLEAIGAEEMLMLLRAFNNLFDAPVPADFAARSVAYNRLTADDAKCAEMDRICVHEVAVAKITAKLLKDFLGKR
jgi:hypothetical protein